MKVKMLETQAGSVDGINVVNYKKDQEYDLEGDLLNVFLNKLKAAEPVEEVKMVEVPSNKAVKVEKEEKEE